MPHQLRGNTGVPGEPGPQAPPGLAGPSSLSALLTVIGPTVEVPPTRSPARWQNAPRACARSAAAASEMESSHTSWFITIGSNTPIALQIHASLECALPAAKRSRRACPQPHAPGSAHGRATRELEGGARGKQRLVRRKRLLLILAPVAFAAPLSGCTKADEEAASTTPAQEERQQPATPSSPPPGESPPSQSSGSESPGGSGGSGSESSGGSEQDEVWSPSHAGDSQFCSEHTCIGSFTTEEGTVVECSDGTYSHAGGISGACSHHGGEQRMTTGRI